MFWFLDYLSYDFDRYRLTQVNPPMTSFFRSVNITIPWKTRRNGTLFLYAFIHPVKDSPLGSTSSKQKFQLSKYEIPKESVFNLIRETKKKVIFFYEFGVCYILLNETGRLGTFLVHFLVSVLIFGWYRTSV